ncbi:exodeoxyribonuclease V, alpha subunit [Burkholderiales bacterium JOSHI_001]|nr:exodeoxyribonuclease V, alpha subunit [Burkholderiales bacterium JOSHI_001]
MSPSEMLQTLDRWRAAGWLRSLDVVLARFINETDPAAPASLLLGAALVAHLEGRGHSGLPMDDLVTDPQGVLAWPAESQDEWHAAGACWPADAGERQQAWQGLASVALDPADDEAGASPLVASGGLLYLRRFWAHESRVAAQVRQRAASRVDGIDAAAARALLDRLFETRPVLDGPDWQKVACALALRGRLSLVTGGPGTGKTFTAARLLVLLQSLHSGPQPLRVAMAAPTGKAAARLRQSISMALQGLGEPLATALALDRWASSLGPARTLHSLLGTQSGTRRFRHDAAHPLDVDLLFVDEASMVHLEMMALLLDALPAHARLVLLGDKDQLASVEAGAVMGDLCQVAGEGSAAAGYTRETADWVRQVAGHELPAASLGDGPPLAQQTVVLRQSHRFDGPIGQLALAVNRGDAGAALDGLRQTSSGAVAMVTAREPAAVLPLVLQGRGGAPGGYRPYLEALAQRPTQADGMQFEAWAKTVLRRFDAFRVLCAVREGAWGVGGLNLAIERTLAEAGLLARRSEWYEGRPVMVTRNDPGLGVFNGDIGIVLRAPGDGVALRCHFLDGDSLRSVAVGRLADVETAFAMTVHKSQGSEFEHVVLVLPEEDTPGLTRELVYTGITRASRAFTLVARHASVLASAVERLTQRVSGLRHRL